MSQKSHEPQADYFTECDPADENPLDRANYNNFETDEIDRLAGDNKGLRFEIHCLRDVVLEKDKQLASIKAEFNAAYATVPPIFRERWAGVARLLGVDA